MPSRNLCVHHRLPPRGGRFAYLAHCESGRPAHDSPCRGSYLRSYLLSVTAAADSMDRVGRRMTVTSLTDSRPFQVLASASGKSDLVYKMDNVRRTQNGRYRCKATNVIDESGVPDSYVRTGQATTALTVQCTFAAAAAERRVGVACAHIRAKRRVVRRTKRLVA